MSQETASVEPPATAEHLAIARLRLHLGDALIGAEMSLGQPAITVRREAILPATVALRDDPMLKYIRLSDICGVDNLKRGITPRFEVVYHLHSFLRNEWVRLKAPVDERDPVVPSIVSEWPAANWFEREIYDMFGIQFSGHPNLTRILMPDDWEGHPLRKDYPIYGEEVEFTVNFGKVQRREIGYG